MVASPRVDSRKSEAGLEPGPPLCPGPRPPLCVVTVLQSASYVGSTMAPKSLCPLRHWVWTEEQAYQVFPAPAPAPAPFLVDRLLRTQWQA